MPHLYKARHHNLPHIYTTEFTAKWQKDNYKVGIRQSMSSTYTLRTFYTFSMIPRFHQYIKSDMSLGFRKPLSKPTTITIKCHALPNVH